MAEHKRNQRVGKGLKGCWRTGTLIEDDAGQLEAYYQVHTYMSADSVSHVTGSRQLWVVVGACLTFFRELHDWIHHDAAWNAASL